MDNQNVVENKTEEVVVEQQNAQQQVQTPVAQTAAPAEQQKGGFGAWLKKHWKGVAAGVSALGAIGGSAVVAYKRGKAAGVASVPVPMAEPEDYSLDPNKD